MDCGGTSNAKLEKAGDTILQEIDGPFGLGSLKSVREFKIEDMPEEFKTSIEKKTKELNWGEGDIAIFIDNIH